MINWFLLLPLLFKGFFLSLMFDVCMQSLVIRCLTLSTIRGLKASLTTFTCKKKKKEKKKANRKEKWPKFYLLLVIFKINFLKISKISKVKQKNCKIAGTMARANVNKANFIISKLCFPHPLIIHLTRVYNVLLTHV